MEANVCALCADTVGVPVQLTACECKTLYCLHCLRDMVGLNADKALHLRCPTCRKELPLATNAGAYYSRQRWMEGSLDSTHGPMLCPRGCGSAYLRSQFDRHVRECPKTRKVCRDCKIAYMSCESVHRETCRGSEPTRLLADNS